MASTDAPQLYRTTRILAEATEHASTTCGRGAILGRNDNTGYIIIIPLCCKKWTCPACARRLSRRWAAKAAAALPERFITLTVDPKLHPDPVEAHLALKTAFQTMVKVWRKRKKTFEYLAIWELQKSGMPHLHVLQKGHFIPQKWIKAFMIRAGVGEIVDINRIRSGEGAAYYVAKYTSKDTADTKHQLGTGRLILCSKHFLAPPALPDPTADTEPVTWTWTKASPYKILKLLLTFNHYTLDDDRFPAAVVLKPGPEILDLDVIMFYLDPRTLDARDEFT